MRQKRLNLKEFLIERAIFAGGILSIILVLLIFGFVFREGVPLLNTYSFSKFLFGRQWQPTLDPPLGPWFGLLPNLWGSVFVTLGAVCIAVPLGVCSAIYISEVATRNQRDFLKPFIELLASVPSVAVGFVGVVAVGPMLKSLFHLDSGKNAMLGSLMLGFMAIPIITTISEDALAAVPRAHRDGSLALGATRWQGIIGVIVPAARPGIIAAVMLGIGRVIGETIIVIMVTNNAAVLPEHGLWYAFTHSIRTITASIGAEAMEVPFQSDHYRALFLLGAVLFGITFLLNFLADLALNKQQRKAQG